jgi:hypothetical protein
VNRSAEDIPHEAEEAVRTRQPEATPTAAPDDEGAPEGEVEEGDS